MLDDKLIRLICYLLLRQASQVLVKALPVQVSQKHAIVAAVC